MESFSDSAMVLEGQKMFQILAEAKALEQQGKDIIHFEIGDPDFSTPKNIVDKCIKSLLAGDTHYTTSYGLTTFREAAAERTFASRGFRPDLEQILVTQGANIQIYFALACIANPGDEVITVDPSFVSYGTIMKFIGIRPVLIPLREENFFKIDTNDLTRAVTRKTKAILINSPHNPTGAVMSEDEITKIYDFAKKNNLYLISDEVYGRMVFSDSKNKFFSPGSIDKCKERTIIIHSFSKSYAMTGWRIGAVTGPVKLIQKMALLLETITSCVSPFIQIAATEALNSSQEEIRRMMDIFQARRDLMYDLINEIPDLSCIRPEGAFYIFPNITQTGLSDVDFSKKALKDAGVAVCPGSFFGEHGRGFIRLCFANSEEKIVEGIERIKKVF